MQWVEILFEGVFLSVSTKVVNFGTLPLKGWLITFMKIS